MKIIVENKHIYWDNDEERWFFNNDDNFEKAQTLADYKKQVVKEVCEEIRKFYTTPIYDRENAHTDVRVLLSRLDKIEKDL